MSGSKIEDVEKIFKKNQEYKDFKHHLSFLSKNARELGSYSSIFIQRLYTHDWSSFELKRSLRLLKFILLLFSAHPWGFCEGIGALIKSSHTISNSPDQDKLLHVVATVLQRLLCLCPMAKPILLPKLAENMPYFTRSKSYVLNYFKLCFLLIELIPSLDKELISIIFTAINNIDSEIPKKNFSALLEIFDQSNMGKLEPSSVNLGPLAVQPGSKQWLNAIDNLDSIVKITIYQMIVYRLKVDDFNKFYNILMHAFFNHVLKCRDLCVSPYIYFYFMSSNEEICCRFIHDLWKHFKNSITPDYEKHSAINYLCGILGLSKVVTLNVFEAYVVCISKWVCRTMKNLGSIDPHKPVSYSSVHHLFYAVCQALFYAISMRINYLKQIEPDPSFENLRQKLLTNTNLESIVFSIFDPLSVCSVEILDLFIQSVFDYNTIRSQGALAPKNKVTFRTLNSNEPQSANFSYSNSLSCSYGFPLTFGLLPAIKEYLSPILIQWK